MARLSSERSLVGRSYAKYACVFVRRWCWSPAVTIIDWEFFLPHAKTRKRSAAAAAAARSLKLLLFSSGKERGPRAASAPAPPPARIKSRICYNLNNCAADEFKILQSYLLVGHKALLIIILEDFRFWGAAQSPPHVLAASASRRRERRTSRGRTELRSSPNLQDAHARLTTLPAAAPDHGTVRVVFNLRVGRRTGGRTEISTSILHVKLFAGVDVSCLSPVHYCSRLAVASCSSSLDGLFS